MYIIILHKNWIKLPVIGLLLIFFIPQALAEIPNLNKDMPLHNGALVWHINDELGTRSINILESKSRKLKLSYDISDCTFCEGEDDNCDQDGVFELWHQGTGGKLSITCHVGAHSQRLMIFNPKLNANGPVFEQTGLYFIDYEFVNNGLIIRYDTLGDDSAQTPQIKTIYWPGMLYREEHKMSSILKTILNIVDDHSRKASESEYDRGVAIRAISIARKKINSMPLKNDHAAYKESVLEALEALKSTYNDTDGQYTNGKGVLGSLIDDIRIKVS